MPILRFEVQHKFVNGTHVLFVAKDVPQAMGAGLLAADPDAARAEMKFGVAMQAAKRRGKVPQDAVWHFARGYQRALQDGFA